MATVTETLRIGPADHGRPMTLAEFEDAEETPGYCYELGQGVLEVSQIPGEPHNILEWFFLARIRDYDVAHPGTITMAGGPSMFRLWVPEMASARHPDVSVVLAGTRRVGGRRPPSLVIEVVSPGEVARRRDYVVKREEYLAYGIREYWIVDRLTRAVTVLTREDDAWVEHVFDRDDQPAASRILPGFAVLPAELWVAADGAFENDETDENP